MLALEMGKHLHELHEMPNADYVKWAAFYTWRYVQQDHARQVSHARAVAAARKR